MIEKQHQMQNIDLKLELDALSSAHAPSQVYQLPKFTAIRA